MFVDQTKENQKPNEKVRFREISSFNILCFSKAANDDDNDVQVMQTDAQAVECESAPLEQATASLTDAQHSLITTNVRQTIRYFCFDTQSLCLAI